MKKIIFTLLTVFFAALSMDAVEMKDLKIYINPGHGGYDSDDRPITIYPYLQSDTLGYWESKSNLYKGLHMYYILKSLGATPYLSRIKNRTEDDRSLSGIAQEANQLGCDLFFSIHTNAGETVNYPLMLYRETTVGTPRYPEAITLSNLLWKNLHSSKVSLWTRDNPYVSGDLTFYPQWGTSGLGVLRNLWVVGLLSEGGMHEHRPEAHRLMNDDFWWLEAWHFVRTIMEFYDTTDKFTTGNVAGVVYDNHNTREYTLNPVYYSAYGRDKKEPLNKIQIELKDADGNVVQTRITDNENNGVYVFRDVKPGKYKVVATDEKYYTNTKDVEVIANEVSYQDLPMDLKRETPLVVESYSPNVDDQARVSCVQPIVFTFNHDVDEASLKKALIISPETDGEIIFSESYHKAEFRPSIAFATDTKYSVTLTTDLCTPDPVYAQSHLAQNLEFSFTTQGRNKLELISSFPEEGGAVHYKSPNLEFRFDKTLDAGGIFDKIKIFDKNNAIIAINQRSSSFNRLSNGYGNIILVLNSNLNVGENYKVVLSPEIKDKEGIPLSDEVTINFTASDAGEIKSGELLQDFEVANIFVADQENCVDMKTLPTYLLSTSRSLFGKASGKFVYKYANAKGGTAVWKYAGDMKIVENGYKLGVHVFGDLNGHEILLGFTAGTDTKYEKLCDDDFLGWRYFTHTLTTLEGNNTEYLLSNVKLIQKEAPYAQDGGFHIDEMLVLDKSGIDDATIGLEYEVYPNPATEYVSVKGMDGIHALELYNTQGSLVAKANQNIISVKGLPSATYIMKIITPSKIYVEKVIKK